MPAKIAAATAPKDVKKGAGKPENKGGAKPGKPAEVKQMMNQKEAYDAVKEYMIKVF